MLEVLLTGLIMVVPFVPSCVQVGDRQIQSALRQLEELVGPKTAKGWKRKDYEELRRLRDLFAVKGDAAADILLAKLESLNEEGRKCELPDDLFLAGHVTAGESPKAAMDAIASLPPCYGRAMESSHLRGTIAQVLADMYENVSPPNERRILRTLIASYVSFDDFIQHSNQLDFALFRIGPPVVPYMLAAASQGSTNLRCLQSSNLDILAAEFLGGPSSSVAKPPKLASVCRASAQDRETTIGEWRRWWEQTGQKLSFPKVPSLIDEIPKN